MARPRTRSSDRRSGCRSGDAAGGTRDPAASAEYLHQKVRLVRAEADKVALQVARLRGELVPAAEAQRRFDEVLLALRDRVLRVESVVPLLYAAARGGGMEAMRPILREELRAALDVGPAAPAADEPG